MITKVIISHEGIRCVRGKNLRDFLSQIAAISQVGDSGNLRQLGTDNRAPNRPLDRQASSQTKLQVIM